MADGTKSTRAAAPAELYPMVNWKYDLFQWLMSMLVDLFFREVSPRGGWKVPKSGPVLFVAAPHANQFVDGIVLQRTLRREAGRRVSQLIAQKSVHGIVGWLSRQVGSVPVGRAQDAARPASGTIYLPSPVDDPTLVRGIGTKFGQGEGEVGGLIFLPSAKKQTGASVDIAQIIGPNEIRVKRPFKGLLALEQLSGRQDIDDDGNLLDRDLKGPGRPDFTGSKFKLAPHIDQTTVYEAVFNRLRTGGCVGIFPEGGSHDRTELLPLKAGVAIMALGALAGAPDCGLKIVPVGMNYFHAHKFRSRAVVEFGPPFEVPAKLVEMYRGDQRRDAIGQLLDVFYQALSSVTVSTPDYDTLMLIQAARRLYDPTGNGNTGSKKLPLPVVVELNRRLAMGYERYKDDERIVRLKAAVSKFNKQLRYLNLRDHQVQYGRLSPPTVALTLLYRVLMLCLLAVAVLPGLVLFSPVFIATKLFSAKMAKEALAGSSVKIQGRDVMATWKILVAMFLAPTLYHLYSSLLTLKVYHDRLWGTVPAWVPLWLVYVSAWPAMVALSFAALRFGEVGMDIFKSLRPLVMCLIPSSNYNVRQLRVRRAELSTQVTDLINTLGPEMFPGEFDRFMRAEQARDQQQQQHAVDPTAWVTPWPSWWGPGGMPEATPATLPPLLSRRSIQSSSRALPRHDSFSDIGGVAMFSTRPSSRNRSRSSSSGGFSVPGFVTLDAAGGLDEATRRIRDAMKARRRQTPTAAAAAEVDMEGSGSESGSEEEEEEAEGYEDVRKKNA